MKTAILEHNAKTKALLAKLSEADDTLAQILDLAASAIDTLLPESDEPQDDQKLARFESATTDYFALMNDVQLFLRSAVFHLVHNAKRPPLTPAQTTTTFNALRAATTPKGHLLQPEDFASASPHRSAGGVQGQEPHSMATDESKPKPAQGLPDDALLSIGALRIQHQAWSDLASALEALQSG
ncbi:hypothetical protein OC846_003537 [Tilletia horrida]|uniref:Mediator of RNA polymerase II transcription subunit 11 n=1 Tax=Tilletia horrida TaxID=155126 RepID=A0AAN6JTT9_9BASI|nr:hypothetical protein OC846_003537 [Tilletia horrida]KAK0565918.1 hypothetical protein OC861_003506 [Tilletia horrida]